MTGLLLEQPARELAPAGRFPGSVLARLVARRAVRSGALWGLIFGLFIIVQNSPTTWSSPTIGVPIRTFATPSASCSQRM